MENCINSEIDWEKIRVYAAIKIYPIVFKNSYNSKAAASNTVECVDELINILKNKKL